MISWDVWSGDDLLGTVRLVGTTISVTGPEAAVLEELLEELRRPHPVLHPGRPRTALLSDTELMDSLPRRLNGQGAYLRPEGASNILYDDGSE